jgi:DNA polymerase elongation subunit (family B)
MTPPKLDLSRRSPDIVVATMTATPLQFQILGSSAGDVAGAYQITLFGTTAEGDSISVAVSGFCPYFYVELPASWTSRDRIAYEQYLTRKLRPAELRQVILSVEKHKSFWDFNDNQCLTFLKVQTESKSLWTKIRNVCQDKETCLPIPYKGQKLRVFEANIDPMLRFFHLRELKPAGWAAIAEDAYDDQDDAVTATAIQVTAEWTSIDPAPAAVQLTTAPLRVMSWDIECTSSHGDFPQAIKTWRKPAREAVEARLSATALREAILAAGLSPLSQIYTVAPVTSESLASLLTEWPSINLGAEDAIDRAEEMMNRFLPPIRGDPIIQIGSVVYVNGKARQKDIFVLGTCEAIADVNVHACENERQLIVKWCQMIAAVDPDIMVGYNIFGFDDKYLWDRATVNGCTNVLRAFSRVRDRAPELQEKFLSSSAMGDNSFHVISAIGRLHIDLLAYVRRNAVLESYSLDNVTATFMSGLVLSVLPVGGTEFTVKTKSTKGTIAGRYIVLMDEENDIIGDKLLVVSVEPKALLVRIADGGEALREHSLPPTRWAQSKDDVSPKDIFALHAQGPNERARVAAYCIQDCDLVMELMQKLEVLNNSIAMANVCWVPVEFIFTRGQGIKSESLVFYECRKEGQLIPVLQAPPRRKEEGVADLDAAIAPVPEIIHDDNEGYEGAIVLDPLSGIYLDDEPVAALDFSSLYPSSIISENLSHDSVVWVKDYDLDGNLVCIKEGSDTYDNLPGWDYLEVAYDILRPDPTDTRKHPPLRPAGRRVCRFAQPLDHTHKSTLPKILQKLLSQRKATRKQAEKETDDFKKSLLDAQQLAYKLTANSLYGQLGSNTSKIRRKCIAASTTGHGRQQLMFSKACIEAVYGPDPATGKPVDPRCSAVCVYGDTDSVFISFRPTDPVTGERLTGRAAQTAAKALAEEAGQAISRALKPPHDFEFDKMFRCFCLLSKKRYFGDMTEGGLEDDDYHRKSMGIVMKRRDNAPIVKYVYGGVIERILNQRNIVAAFEFVRQAIRDLLAGKFSMKRLTITKSLRAEYKLIPAHKILAERIGRRDPGNKPSSNDRIPFVYTLQPSGKSWSKATKQGERIETPTYIREHGLKPDYPFYITNQIAKPVAQVFGLVVERLPGVKAHQVKAATTAEAREKLAEDLLFADLIRGASGQTDLLSYFKKV